MLPICSAKCSYLWDMQRVDGPHILDPSMLMGLMERTVAICMCGVAALLPMSDVGVGYNSLALKVGDSGLRKPGYLRPTSVRTVRLGRSASG